MKRLFCLLTTIVFLIPSLVNAETIDRETFEKAFKETAYAYYMRGENIQYNSQKTNATDSVFSPEEATSQNINYSVCSALSYYVYNDLLGIKIPHYTTNLLKYARTKGNDPKNTSNVIAYGKKNATGDLEMIFYEKDGKITTKTNPTVYDILPYLRPGDVLTYTGHNVMIYDLKYDNEGNVVNAYTIESGHGNGEYHASSKIGGSNHKLYQNSRNSIKVVSEVTNGNTVVEGSLHMSLLTGIGIWKSLNPDNENGYEVLKDEYSIVRFVDEKDGKVVLNYYGNEHNGDYIELSDKTKDRLKFDRLYIEKTVDKHNDDTVNVGDILEYKIVVKNNSNNEYTNDLIVTEDISDYVDYNDEYTINKSNVTYNKISNKKIEFNIGKLDSKEEVMITYKVEVKPQNVGNVIVSDGTVGNIPSSQVKNVVGNSLNSNQKNAIIANYNALKNNTNYNGKQFINEVYSDIIGSNIGIDTFEIDDLLLTTKYGKTLTLNNKNPFYQSILNKYYSSLYVVKNSDGTDGYYDMIFWRKYDNPLRRADTIYKENFMVGDILIYKNTDDTTTKENGEYYYIYICDSSNNCGFVGKNGNGESIRNEFNVNYYTNNGLSVYSNNDETNSDFLEFINYQTLLGKDAYVILRPAMMSLRLNENSNNYKIIYDKKIIYNIDKGNGTDTLTSLNTSLYSPGRITGIYDKSGNKVTALNAKTGDTIKIVFDDESTTSYKLSIRGEVTGTGNSILDAKRISKHIIDGNVITEDEYLLAADYNGDDNIKMNDVVKLLKENN